MELPQHVAIIMDGNRRWAREKNLPEMEGHRAGVKSIDRITEACARLGVKGLTLYGFSTENWKRPKKAVEALFSLMEQGIERYLSKVEENNMRLKMIGRIEELPETLRKKLKDAAKKTFSNTGMILTMALNYGSRQEIIDAVKAICERSKKENIDISSLDEEKFEKFLYTSDLPVLDLVIRTSGEMRLSNFLLWQAAYSELYVTDTLWPDFDERELKKAFDEYAKRSRRFGK